MTSFTINSVTGTSQILAAGDYGTFLAPGGYVGTGTGVQFNGKAFLFNYGVINSTLNSAIFLQSAGEIVNEGFITSLGAAIMSAEQGQGVMTLLNNGSIVSMSAPALDMATGGLDLNNTGRIQAADSSAILIGDGGVGAPEDVQIVNSGIISAMQGRSAIEVVHANADGNGDLLWVTNSGTILGGITYNGIIDGGGFVRVYNSGLIDGQGMDAINTSTVPGIVMNTGTIMGDIVFFGQVTANQPPVQQVINHGLIQGRILFAGTVGTAVLRNSDTIHGNVEVMNSVGLIDSRYGLIEGTVFGGTGGDIVLGGLSDDDIRGGAGTDTLQGGLGSDTIAGGLDADTILGQDGSDSLGGDEGADLIRGGEGADSVSGGAQDDTIWGDGGSDWLMGDSGNDLIRGGDGDDIINGHLGRDILFGDGGDDSFVFFNATHSGLGAASDVIRDFTVGEDVIDLDAVSTDTFAFAGSGPFAGGGAPSLTVTTSATATLVNLDTDGNGVADMRIVLTGLHALTAADFVL